MKTKIAVRCLYFLTVAVFSIYIFWLTTGTITGSKKIGSIDMGAAVEGSRGSYKVNDEKLSSLMKETLKGTESDFNVLLPLPAKFYDWKICGKLTGHNYAAIRIIFDQPSELNTGNNIEIVVGKDNPVPCLQYTYDKNILFRTDNPRGSLASLKEDEVDDYFDCLSIMLENGTHFLHNAKNKNMSKEDCNKKYSNKLEFRYQVVGPIKLIYFFSTIFVLGLISLLDANFKIMESIVRFIENRKSL